ncbi:MAG: SCO family protein [Bacteroidetes bacterium]|nr:MAG: SCO family protein [Bacteroidota bacterium]
MRTALWNILAVLFVVRPGTAEEAVQNLYRRVPDIAVITSDGRTESLSALSKGMPVMITIANSRCTGICYPWLFQLRDRVSESGAELSGIRFIILSIDERDTPMNVAAMAEMLKMHHDKRWLFGTVRTEDRDRFAEAFGFTYRFDSLRSQYDHPPMLAGVNANGVVLRILSSMELTPTEFWLLVREMHDEFIPMMKATEASWVTCFTYDPLSNQYSISWGVVMLYLPVLAGFALVWWIFRSSGRRRRQQSPGLHTDLNGLS